MIWTSPFGEPYKSIEEASKAKRSSLIGLFTIIALHNGIALFMWYFSTHLTKENFSGWPNLDGLILLILSGVLYHRFTRTVASIVLLFVALKFLAHWALTGFGAPPGLTTLLLLSAVQVAVVVFKVHDWEQNNPKLSPPKWSGWALLGATILTTIGLILHPAYLFYHINTHTSVTENGNTIVYSDAADKYTITYPTTWQKVWSFHSHYGSVVVSPKDNTEVRIEVERWQPRSIVPTTLYKEDAFMDMMRSEASSTSK